MRAVAAGVRIFRHRVRSFERLGTFRSMNCRNVRFLGSNSEKEHLDEKVGAGARSRAKLKEIQRQQIELLKQSQQSNKSSVQSKEEEIKTERSAMRRSDGFLEFNDVDPPWTLRSKSESYNGKFFLEDVNYNMRKSKKADHALGDGSIVVVGGMMTAAYFNGWGY